MFKRWQSTESDWEPLQLIIKMLKGTENLNKLQLTPVISKQYFKQMDQ